MKVYQFDLQIAVPDDVDEGTLLTRVSEFAQDCGGDPLAPASLRAEAKASLVASPQYGGDPTDYFEWTRQALEAVGKASPTDVLEDLRTRR